LTKTKAEAGSKEDPAESGLTNAGYFRDATREDHPIRRVAGNRRPGAHGMVKDQNPRDELADFDPEAPPEEPPDELAIERQRQRLYVGLLVLLVAILAVLTLRGCPRAKDPGNLTPTAWLPASPLVNLQGLEVTTLGPREGPYIVLDVPGPREVTLGNVNLPSQTCRLIGLSGGDGATEQELTSMTQVQRDAYRDRLQRMDAFRRQAPLHPAHDGGRAGPTQSDLLVAADFRNQHQRRPPEPQRPGLPGQRLAAARG
jgi:hypothetical protein